MNIVSIASTIHNSNKNAREIISQKSSRALCIIFVLERVSTPEEYPDRVVYIAMNIVTIFSTIRNSNGNAREIISQKSCRALCIIYVLERVSTPEGEDADADTDRGSWPLAHLLQQKYFINTENYKCNNFITCPLVSILYCVRNILDVNAFSWVCAMQCFDH